MNSCRISRRQHEKILSVMAYGLLLVDTLNGFFLQAIKVDIKISIIYKFIFLMIGLTYLSRVNVKLFMFSTAIVIYIFLWAALMNFNSNWGFFFKDFGEAIKLASLILVYNIFSCFTETDCRKFIINFVVISSLIVFLNIMFSLLGFGFQSYGNFGAKGFFYAGNALSGIVVIFGSFILVYFYNSSHTKFVIAFILLIIFSFVIGTKSGVLGLFLSFVFIVFYHTKLSMGSIVKFVIILLSIAFCGFQLFDFIVSTAFYERILFFYESGGLMRALLSDRDKSFLLIYNNFMNADVVTVLWGFGIEHLTNSIGDSVVEMDFADILFKFGLFTMSCYLILFFALPFVSLFSIDINDDLIKYLKCVSLVASLVLVLIALIAGHILFNGLVTFAWGVTLSLPRWRTNNLNNKYQFVDFEA